MSDGRIGHSHYQVPGFDGDMGFGGGCFPKDINAFINTMEESEIDPIVLKAVWEQNKNVRKNWDWSTMESAVKKETV
jgi:UDPglucose 6-dehydrogenase